MIPRTILVMLLTLGLTSGLVVAQTIVDSPEKQGQAAAVQWLKVIDNGDYGVSWEQTAAFFREKVTKEQWQAAMNQVRSPLGKTISRTLKTAMHTKTMQGMPEGDYVIIQFDTTFEKKEGAVETVTMMKEGDDTWRVIGSFIR